MTLFIIFGIVVCIALAVVGALFYLLSKESQKADVKAVPIANPHEVFKSGPSIQEREYKRRVDELEVELKSISEKGTAQSQQALAMVDELKKENEELKGQRFKENQEFSKELHALRQQTTDLSRDNSALQIQLESSQSKAQALQDEAIAIQKQMKTELAQAQDQLAQGTSQTAALQEAQNRIEVLQQELQELQTAHKKLQELNAAELLKHRAQSSGWERLCENYRLELQKRI